MGRIEPGSAGSLVACVEGILMQLRLGMVAEQRDYLIDVKGGWELRNFSRLA